MTFSATCANAESERYPLRRYGYRVGVSRKAPVKAQVEAQVK